MKRIHPDWTVLLLVLILTVSFLARAYGANFPRYHWDEGIGIDNVLYASYENLRLMTYVHGSFLQYLILLTWYAYLALSGIAPSTGSLMMGFYRDTASFMLLARGLLIVAGTATVAGVYLLGRRLYGTRVGLLSAFFIGLTFLHASESHYARGHIPSALFVALTVYYSTGILIQGRTRDYVLAGICVGLASSAQYSAILAILPLYIAHLGRVCSTRAGRGWRGWLLDRNLLLGLDAAGVAFFLVTPYALLDFTYFASEIKAFLVHAVAQTWVSPEGQPVFLFYLTEHLRNGMGTGLELVALAGVAYTAYRHRWKDAVLLVFPLALYITLAKGENFARYAVLLLPFLAIAAARLLHDGAGWLETRTSQTWANGILVMLAAFLVTPSALNIIKFDYWLTQPDTRLLATEWITANIPDNSTMVVEGAGVLGPPLPSSRVVITANMASQPVGSIEYLHLAAIRANLPEGPGYNISSVFRLDQRHEGGMVVETIPTVQYYAQRGFEYLVTVDWMQRNDADHYSPEFQKSLDTLYEKIADFQPTIAFRFDPYAWRMDYEALASVIPGQSGTGGPHLRIYCLCGHGISSQ